ncbi:MAG: TlpA family protein disulfide reductase [Bdellovibrionaceae bacterium]|nr:TlpA family protein disulfide reductase [Pseudobdellovibrionaceae bacterium]
MVALIVVVLVGSAIISGVLVYERSRLPGQELSFSLQEKFENEGLPDLQVVDFWGKSFSSRSFKGLVVVWNFWASWCSPCVEEVPSLLKLARLWPDKLKVIFISGDNSREDIEVFLKSFPRLRDSILIWDQDRSIANLFGVSKLPETFIAGKDGRLRKKVVGSVDWASEDAKSYFESLVSE